MNAVTSKASPKSVVFFRLTLASAACVAVLQSPGCSGSVITSHDTRSTDGGVNPLTSNGGASGGGRGTGAGNVGGSGDLCGNGIIDPGEECDGYNLAGETCYSITMGAEPSGTLTCTSCLFNLSACYGGGVGGRAGSAGMIGFSGAAGAAGYAGYAGYGGFAGSAGSAGMVGVDPAAVCYANGGVPSPGNPNDCLSGSQAVGTCEKNYITYRYSSSQPLGQSTCASGCGCTLCPSMYDKCATSSDCIYILDCVESTGCSRMVDCYQPSTCQAVIDAVGGQRGRGAIDMSNLLACMANSGCAVSCF